MKVSLVFVPPEGGESDYSLDFELPAIPRPGDYISIRRPNQDGTSDFIVRRTWWHLHYPSDALYQAEGDNTIGTVRGIAVECEFARGPYSGDEHKKSCDMYESRKGTVKSFEDTAY
jgi:hypothetical protein